MDRGGSFPNVPGPSPDLEAVWGPAAAAPQGRRSGRARLAAGAAALLVVAAGAAFALTRDSGAERVVSAASATTVPTVSDAQAANAQAFLERWNAGPSTTMPLGEAGVPPEQRPSTTTTTSTPPAPPPRVRSAPTTLPPWADETSQAPPALAPDDPRLAGAEQAARDFVDAMTRRDCDAVWNAFSTRTKDFFEEMRDGDTSMKDEFCASLQEGEVPPINVRGPARPYRDGAVVDLESGGEVESIVMTLEGDRWMVDLLAAMGVEEGDQAD